jgi:hypothetical protein
MAFTAAQLDHIFNSALDLHLERGRVYAQDQQSMPLLQKFAKGKLKSFPGGKGEITIRVKAGRTFELEGFSGDDQVSFQNAANIKMASYPWKEIHQGMEITETQLKIDGISVVDGANGGGKTVTHDGREKTMLANMLDEQWADFGYDWDYNFNLMLWGDGTSDPSLVPGITSLIVDDPTDGVVVGSIDQSANTWWRNRASLGVAANLSNADDQVLVKLLKTETRQLRRYGGKPDCYLAGADFLDQLENERRAKGTYTQVGWAKSGRGVELSSDEPEFEGIKFEYDPTLDDLGFAKRCYVIDSKAFDVMPMEGEDMKARAPVRPHDQYVYFRAVTWTGGLVCKRRNSSAVYSIA